MLETPSEVCTPKVFSINRSASNVTAAASCPALMVITSASTTMSRFGIPYVAAVSTIFFATASLPSGVSGIPDSSNVRAITTPPYFFTSGKMLRMLSCFPLTELISGLPL